MCLLKINRSLPIDLRIKSKLLSETMKAHMIWPLPASPTLLLGHSSVQSLSHVQLFATPWTAALQASLSITNSRSLLRLVSIELVMPSNHLILCHPLLLLPSIFPCIRKWCFPMSQLFASGGQSIGVSPSASVLSVNIQDWFPLGLTGESSQQCENPVWSLVTMSDLFYTPSVATG